MIVSALLVITGSRVYLALEAQLLELVRRQKTIVYVCQGGCFLMENAHRVHRAHTNWDLGTVFVRTARLCELEHWYTSRREKYG